MYLSCFSLSNSGKTMSTSPSEKVNMHKLYHYADVKRFRLSFLGAFAELEPALA